jgi:SAM-dependent methyltransferase
MIICPNCSNEYSEIDVSCSTCGWESKSFHGIFDFLNDLDRKNSFFNNYQENYEGLAKKNLEKSNIDRRFLAYQAENLLKYIGSVTGKTVCDVGIGQGFLCDKLIDAGAKRVVAIDVSPSYLLKYSENEKVSAFIANAENLPFKNEFEVVTSTDVMEHVINVGSFLFSINRALKLNGITALRVPYREGLLNYSPHKGYQHDFGHLRSFNKDILRIYLKQAGFSIRSFHLDGFSLGTPQDWLYNTDRRRAFYHKFYNICAKNIKHIEDVALWPSLLARLFMRPVEIVVVATKQAEI